ncbi:MAG: LuxR C-terminal-related transcriptional regulator [Acidimicrobiales bacterium]
MGQTARHRLAPVGHDRRRSGTPEQPRLYERQAFLNEFAAMFSGSWPHANGTVVIEGFHWTGRTALLGAACRLARERRLSVLRARGSYLDIAAPWGVVRQLFGDKLDGSTGSDRRAGAVAAKLGAAGDSTLDEPKLAEIYDDLDTLLNELATGSPVLLAVDDADQADMHSAGWLSHLARHLEHHNVRLVITAAHRQRGTPLSAIDRIRSEPQTRAMTLRPLGRAATATLLGLSPKNAFTERLVDALHAACGGCPYLVASVARALTTSPLPADGEAAQAVGNTISARVGRAVLARLVALPCETSALLALLEAVAVLDGDADLSTCALFCGLGIPAIDGLVDCLVDDGLLSAGNFLRFEQGVVRTALLAEMGSSRRSMAHVAAARVLDHRGAPAEAVARHLLHAEPLGDPWAATRLEEAGKEALGRGDLATASALLSKALNAGPEGAGPQLLLDLAYASSEVDLEAATRHLRRAIELGADPSEAASVALTLAGAIPDGGEAPAVLGLLDEVAARLPHTSRDLRIEIEVAVADITRAAVRRAGARRVVAGLLETAPTPPTIGGSAQRLGLALVAVAGSATSQGPASQIALWVKRALSPSELASGDRWAVRLRARAVQALGQAGELPQAAALVSMALEQARKSANPNVEAEFSLSLAYLLLAEGRLKEAHAAVSECLRTMDGRPWRTRPLALACLGEVLLAQGRRAEALDLLTAPPGGFEAGTPTPEGRRFLEQRGRSLLLANRVDAAMSDFELAKRWAELEGADNPGTTGWRSGMTGCLLAQGSPNKALLLAQENVGLARGFGAPWLIGATLVEAAIASPPAARLALLREAVEVLDGAGTSVTLAGALIELGTELLRDSRCTPEALGVLRRGADLASRCGAGELAERAASALRSAGARPRRLAMTGPHALTPAEWRVAELAAAGRSNSEIASQLHLARKTVEGHLARVYRKLEVRSREQLADHLTDGP